MKFISHLRKSVDYESVSWHESTAIDGARFAIRRISLAQRIELAQKAREIGIQYEFLKAGQPNDQLEAALADLLVRRLYLRWGLVEIQGLKIDGQQATGDVLIERGPDALSNEIVERIKAETELSEEERKNF